MMFTVFFDTNIFLDFFLDRRPASTYAVQLLKMAEQNQFTAYTSSSNIINIIYFLKKAGFPQSDIIENITDLLSIIHLVSPNKQAFTTALTAGFRDLEDAVQYHTALQVSGMDYFVTNNIRDFKKVSLLTVIIPSKMISLLTSA